MSIHAASEECERILAALKDHGYRLTGPRRALVQVIVRSAEPLSVQEIHAAANELAQQDSGNNHSGNGNGNGSGNNGSGHSNNDNNDGRRNGHGDNAAARAGEEINLVTVYRFANLLVDLGLARRVEFGQGYYRYEREEPQDGPHHHHLICQNCGRIEDFVGCDIGEQWTARLEAESGFKLVRHELELYGTCPACQTA